MHPHSDYDLDCSVFFLIGQLFHLAYAFPSLVSLCIYSFLTPLSKKSARMENLSWDGGGAQSYYLGVEWTSKHFAVGLHMAGRTLRVHVGSSLSSNIERCVARDPT